MDLDTLGIPGLIETSPRKRTLWRKLWLALRCLLAWIVLGVSFNLTQRALDWGFDHLLAQAHSAWWLQ